MDALLVKIFATALTLSQATSGPDALKIQFDRVADQKEVVSLLRAGCLNMRKAFDIEDVNVDDLIATVMDDPDVVSGTMPAFKGLNLNDLLVAYRQFCKNETVTNSPVDLAEVIDFRNKAVADLPDPSRLKDLKLPSASVVLDAKGERFAEIFEANQRRVFVPLGEIPEHVQKAFIAAEDKRFYQHKGVDERALIRAFIGNLAKPGRPQGGSTITQQVVKNLAVGDDPTYERKIREMIVATDLERVLTKPEILQLYLNSTYLGRGSWGVEMAARSYFGKSAKELTLAEGALLAGLTKGPTAFNPDRYPERAQERLAYVLTRMQEDGAISTEEMKQAQNALPRMVADERPRRDTGFHFIDHLSREAKTVAGIDLGPADSYTVRSTIIPALQRATETALQEGLARYEMDNHRLQFQGAETNLSDPIKRIETEGKASPKRPAWLQALEGARLPLYDVHWPAAVVVEKAAAKGRGTIKVGLADGRILSLSASGVASQNALKLHDVVRVRVIEGKGRTAAQAELRVRPTVQGAALVIENKTGGILAMAGGFSYPLSQLNRTTQSRRQPGSALKPLTYLAALQKGLQPNTLVRDQDITLPPIRKNGFFTRGQQSWSPKNYDGGSSGTITLRHALENSRNLATVNLLKGGIENDPEQSLERICTLALAAQIYRECVPYYPFVLGAQPVRPIDLAVFYAAIANEGLRPTPHAIDSIEHEGLIVWRAPESSTRIELADRVAFFQLKTMLQGVLQRGTARSLAHLAPYAAGKTGTTDDENDTWFMGFTNDVTVAIWVGYDNAEGKRRTLGSGQTGAKVAVPIFEPIIQAAWAYHSSKTALNGPSPEALSQLVAVRADSGSRDERSGRGAAVEYLRRDQNSRAQDGAYELISRGRARKSRGVSPSREAAAAPGGQCLGPADELECAAAVVGRSGRLVVSPRREPERNLSVVRIRGR